MGKGVALITVMDINDNAPVFAIEYETFLCENVGPGQVLWLLILQQKGFHIRRDFNTRIVQLNKEIFSDTTQINCALLLLEATNK